MVNVFAVPCYCIDIALHYKYLLTNEIYKSCLRFIDTKGCTKKTKRSNFLLINPVDFFMKIYHQLYENIV